jgi:hypothetical protein
MHAVPAKKGCPPTQDALLLSAAVVLLLTSESSLGIG